MDTHTDAWADWQERMDAFRADVAAHAADVAESGADIADMATVRTAGVLLAMTYEARYGVTGRVAPVDPVAVAPAVPDVPRRVSVRDVIRSWGLSLRPVMTAAA